MRTISLIFAMFVGLAAGAALAQSVGADRVPEQGVTCPPDVKREGPTVGSGSDAPLSDKLARSKGVICPPAGVDRDDPRHATRRRRAEDHSPARHARRRPTRRTEVNAAASARHFSALLSRVPNTALGSVTRTAKRQASQNIAK